MQETGTPVRYSGAFWFKSVSKWLSKAKAAARIEKRFAIFSGKFFILNMTILKK